MLLETLDIKKDDVVIFSRNIFNLEENFNIIYKDDPQKTPKKISYGTVCRFVNEFTPKNMIVYRLLTNIKDFGIYLSKYGFYMNINGITELIYFDPVFAIKELEDYSEAINYYDLRFRIQQVGLTTLNRIGDLPNFAEIYSIDLEATEAKFQNDKAFADAIFVFEKKDEVEKTDRTEAKVKPVKTDVPVKELKKQAEKLGKEVEIKKAEEIEPPKMPMPDKKPAAEKIPEQEKKLDSRKITEHPAKSEKDEENITSPKEVPKEKAASDVKPIPEKKPGVEKKEDKIEPVANGIKIIQHNISEDTDFDYRQIMRMNFKKAAVPKKEVEEKKKPADAGNGKETLPKPIPSLIKHDSSEKKSLGSLLKTTQAYNEPEKPGQTESTEKSSMILDIFKSPASLNKYLTGRENKTVILRLKKE